MEIYSAEVTEVDSENYLSLNIEDEKLLIPLTKDEPNEIKKVFNKLVVFLKKGPFKFSMEDKEDGDIIENVAKEYIGHLNTELDDIYKELTDSNLIESI